MAGNNVNDECWTQILGHLDRKSLYQVIQVSSRFLQLGTQHSLRSWKYFIFNLPWNLSIQRIQQPRFESVQRIMVSDLSVLDFEFDKIPRSVTGLNIERNGGREDDGELARICNFLRSFPKLEELSMFQFFFVDLSQILTSNSTLRVICIGMAIVTDETLEKIASCCPLLETLVLVDTASNECTNEQVYTDKGVRAITKQCLNLQHLELRSSDTARSASLSDIFGDAECKRLTCLFVEESAAGFLNQVVARLPHLEELSIDTEHATPDQVIAAAAGLPSLRRLRVQLGGQWRPYRGRPFNSAQIGRLAAALPRIEDIFLRAAPAVRNPERLFSRRCPSPSLRRVHICPHVKEIGLIVPREPVPWAMFGRCFWTGLGRTVGRTVATGDAAWEDRF